MYRHNYVLNQLTIEGSIIWVGLTQLQESFKFGSRGQQQRKSELQSAIRIRHTIADLKMEGPRWQGM